MHAPISGIVAVAYQLALASVERGHETSLVSFSNGNDRRKFTVDGIHVRRLAPRPRLALKRADLSYAGPLAIFSARSGVDIAHVHSNPFILRAVRAKTKVLHYHTPDFSSAAADASAIKQADAIIFCSNALRMLFVATVGSVQRPLEVAQNGIMLDRFRGNEEAGKRLRHRVGITPEEFVVLFAGQLTERKGAHFLIEAMKNVRQTLDRPVRLLVVGNSMLWQKAGKDPTESPYERTLRAADPELVCFTGALRQDEMPAAYAACNVFALPSNWFEPSPVTIREAMATGRPVVASSVGGIPELVRDGETGILVAPGDVRSLVDALAALLRDPDKCRQMGEAGMLRSQDFEWQKAADHVFDIYNRVRSEGHQPVPDLNGSD
jgi:spore coat protein SA